MASMKWLANALLTCLIAAGCLWTCADLAKAGGPATSNGAANGEKYVLDFSDPPNRGVWVGKFRNFAFRIDLQKTVKRISVPVGDQRLPDLIATFDYADCTKGQESLLERPLRGFAPGDAAWVDEVHVVMVPSEQRELRWTGGVCYGFREPGGKWYWNPVSSPLTYDAGTNRFLARIEVRRGPIDAVKLVFDYAVPPMFVSSVSFTTRAIGPSPDPQYTPPKSRGASGS